MDDQWHHVAYVNSDNGARLYVDGAEVGYTSDYCADIVDAKKLAIGNKYNTTSFPFRGVIDDVRIYGGVADQRRRPDAVRTHRQILENVKRF